MRPNILVIDDDPVIHDVIKAELKDNYHVYSAMSAAQAFDNLMAIVVNVILLDIFMPGVDGFTLLTEIKSVPGYRKIPIIVISSLDDSYFLHKLRTSVAFGHVPKPLKKETLIKMIEDALFFSSKYASGPISENPKLRPLPLVE